MQVDSEAASLAAKLAAGPTRAFGAVRRMLRQSFETGLSDQLDAEKDSIVVASSKMTRRKELPPSSQSVRRIFAAIEPIKLTQTHFRGGRSGLSAKPP